jgi:hypothetical protein
VSIFPKDIIAELQTVLENSSLLSYVDVVTIRKYQGRASIPDFEYYAIVVWPLSANPEPYAAGGQRKIRYSTNLVLLGKTKLVNAEYDLVMADSPNATPPNVGILAMYEDVFLTLYKNDLSGKIELYPGLTELDGRASFDSWQDVDTEEFLFEAIIPYVPSGDRFI